MHGAGAAQRARAGLGEPDRARLAGLHEVGERADAVLDRHVRIDAVELVEIDVRDAESLQARVARRADVLGPPVHAAHAGIPGLAHDAALRREHHALAAIADRAADQLFVGERTVHVGRVEQVDAEVERAVDRGDRLGLVGGAVELAHAHAAQAERRDFEGTETPSLHARLLQPRFTITFLICV